MKSLNKTVLPPHLSFFFSGFRFFWRRLGLKLTCVGVTVLIDSRALFSIIGSTMDFVEDRLSARFVFENPHVKGSCGCGESFSVD